MFLTADKMRGISKEVKKRKKQEFMERVERTPEFQEVYKGISDAANDGVSNYRFMAHDYNYYQAIVDSNKLIKDEDQKLSQAYLDVLQVLEDSGYAVQKMSVKAELVNEENPTTVQMAAIETATIYW